MQTAVFRDTGSANVMPDDEFDAVLEQMDLDLKTWETGRHGALVSS